MRAAQAPRLELPRYNTALGPAEETLVVAPPFSFPGVTARVFPLRASMNLLRAFCQSYLNVAPEVYEFFPYFPYVLLVVLDYGRMAIEQLNLGWVSQHEVFFGVPLGMWRRDRQGRRQFDKWVINTPFIVVDNAASLTTGRETYGWPKVLATLQASPERWLIDPRNPTRYLTLDVKGLDSAAPDVRLLDIDQQTGQNLPLMPPDSAMLDPFARLSRLTRTSLSIGFDLAQLMIGAPLAGFAPGGARDRREVLFDSLRRLSGFYGRPGLDVVTLKQFRDAEDPSLICYQALVESRLSIARYNRGGLLGLYNVLQGDITGGFRIHLHDNPAFPIAASLGLEVAQQRTVGRRLISSLEPILPFWLSVDLTYGKGKTLCWRTRDLPWHQKGIPVGRLPPKVAPLYNTIAGGGEQVWYGPFLIPNAGVDIYALEADPGRLESFLNGYLNAEGQLRFELVKEDGRAFVYMAVSANRMFSRARSGACIASTQVSFYMELVIDPGGLGRRVLATPFSFVDNPVQATTMREFDGLPALYASIETPSHFLRRGGPLLTLRVEVFPALGAGLRSEQRALLEIVRGEEIAAAVPVDDIQASFESQEQGQLVLKQFRDAGQPECACYQSLVVVPWTISDVRTTPFQHEIRVRIYRYPSLPLVETLGLIAEKVEAPAQADGAVADVLMAVRPCRVEASYEVGLGRELFRSAGYRPWTEIKRMP